MEQRFNPSVVHTCVDAEEAWCEASQGIRGFGYFADDLHSLRRAVTEGRVNARCLYGGLEDFMPDDNPRRFVLDKQMFALFYPTDSMLNVLRY